MSLGRKFIAILMTGVFITLTTCQFIDLLPAPAIRSKNTDSYYFLIDEEAIALSNNPAMISIYCDNIIAGINEQRAAVGLSAFVKSIELCAAATVRAQEQEQLFSHTRPDGSEFWTCNSQVCYGECLSRGHNPDNVVNAWMNSDTHRAVLLDNEFKTAGIGTHDENGKCYIALEVGY